MKNMSLMAQKKRWTSRHGGGILKLEDENFPPYLPPGQAVGFHLEKVVFPC